MVTGLFVKTVAFFFGVMLAWAGVKGLDHD